MSKCLNFEPDFLAVTVGIKPDDVASICLHTKKIDTISIF